MYIQIQYALCCEGHPPDDLPEFDTIQYSGQYSGFMRGIKEIAFTDNFSVMGNNIYTLAL